MEDPRKEKKVKGSNSPIDLGEEWTVEDLENLDIKEFRRNNPRLTPSEKLGEYLKQAGMNPDEFDSDELAETALKETAPHLFVLLEVYTEKYPILLANDKRRYGIL
ncbi:MAG: hypothetical protein P1U85_22440 [Verrucomicrobiales bacterium]|nr:hypothetical protein [Verrucomicrobiales bacterium]